MTDRAYSESIIKVIGGRLAVKHRVGTGIHPRRISGQARKHEYKQRRDEIILSYLLDL